MKKMTGCFLLILLGFTEIGSSQSVNIFYESSSARQTYAVNTLQKTLQLKGYSLTKSAADFEIHLKLDTVHLVSEAFSILPSGKKIIITGGDERGMIYGSLSLTEDLQNGIALKNCKPKKEKPFLPLRIIKFDLPWDTYRHSTALSLHDETCRDTSYWKSFLDMMVENRINSLSLWNLHTYPYLIKAKNFPEASPWTEKELKEWQTLFRAIFRMASERAIDTYYYTLQYFCYCRICKSSQCCYG